MCSRLSHEVFRPRPPCTSSDRTYAWPDSVAPPVCPPIPFFPDVCMSVISSSQADPLAHSSADISSRDSPKVVATAWFTSEVTQNSLYNRCLLTKKSFRKHQSVGVCNDKLPNGPNIYRLNLPAQQSLCRPHTFINVTDQSTMQPTFVGFMMQHWLERAA